MAVKGEATRARLIEAARSLLEAKGYHGTGLNEVLAAAGAPRGSLYHHFPGGKDELVGEALKTAGREVDGIVAEAATAASGARELIPAVLEALAGRMVAAGYAKGCPVATVALEVAATNDALQGVCAEIYARWQRSLAGVLRADGHGADDADELAATALALIEGALVLARAARSRVPLDQAGRRLTALLDRG
ncbi:TetR/AcrR family transcriptional regulator [Actinomadura fibrosa]|uniref:TetR/AcrR family transcriptional regulator n=1 Tax=Actinomadura fibrosa TaxID=111802 RepID=A0ABW2XUT8_9ACTN|nr:TetR/AcrR family transcriptional regulator [Actinomadura fibrosa]